LSVLSSICNKILSSLVLGFNFTFCFSLKTFSEKFLLKLLSSKIGWFTAKYFVNLLTFGKITEFSSNYFCKTLCLQTAHFYNVLDFHLLKFQDYFCLFLCLEDFSFDWFKFQNCFSLFLCLEDFSFDLLKFHNCFSLFLCLEDFIKKNCHLIYIKIISGSHITFCKTFIDLYLVHGISPENNSPDWNSRLKRMPTGMNFPFKCLLQL